MPILLLGVQDLPYAGHGNVTKAFVDHPKEFNKEFGLDSNATTGDVAERLEEHYGVMDGFVRMHLSDIESSIMESINAVLEARLAGAPASLSLYDEGLNKIEKLFKMDYIALMEAEHAGLGPGAVPTKAALEGRSSRFKGKKGPRRPSFLDTGLYQSSFKAWID